MSRAPSGSRFARPQTGHATSVIRLMRSNRTVRAVLAAMCLFAVVAAIWAGVGYAYADNGKAAAATTVGLCVLAVGWLGVLVAVAIKILRLRARRRKSTLDD